MQLGQDPLTADGQLYDSSKPADTRIGSTLKYGDSAFLTVINTENERLTDFAGFNITSSIVFLPTPTNTTKPEIFMTDIE